MSLTTESTATAPSPEAEALASALHAAFLRLPPKLQARCTVPPTGDAVIDRPVLVEADNGSDHYQGVVVAGERDQDGRWLLDDAFTLLSLDHDDGPDAALVVCHGWNCHADRL
ncbi:Hypothetical protein HVIM_03887 (plasmid) [Roseomonas mucosa]|uniref:hypothetical protein n=1 Tax=Roseomonas mucosa TaxID=207340 RepID=UPI000DB8B1BD|nr:hypothetical protein [Roseomonas mucosa]PZP46066.1 MAG: hypothetical protein DI601_07840 [Azospirillum brasilense]QDD92803.1 Hypothetical protein HVIM_03887 [Roseomonas mucosa]